MLPVSRRRSLYPALLLALAQLAAAYPCRAALLQGDRDALLAFDLATNRVLSTSRGWGGPPGSECDGSWMGVHCGLVQGQDRVTQLKLGQDEVPVSLAGSLPVEIGNLTALTQFDLTDQSLAGELPASLAMLTNLVRLDFRHNRFSGGNPVTSGLLPFMSMTGLQFLNLEGNSIGGPIPDQIAQLPGLTNLELTGNGLTGPIPAAIGQLTHLQKLWLDANQLAGAIPAEIGNLGALVELRLGGNNIVGPLPASIGNLHSLTLLQVGLAHLSGALPSTLANLSNLQELSLGTNNIAGDLTGVAWESLGQLQRVFLDNNALQGAIPPSLVQLARPSALRLQGNKLTGPVPRDVLARPGLAEIDLRWNGLEADPDVAALLDSLAGGQFSLTQTLAPKTLSAMGMGQTAICLAWAPVSFQDVSGGYQVIYRRADQPEETSQTVVISGKAVPYTVVGGLTPNTVYSFQVQSFSDPHAANQSTVTSDASAPVLGQTAGPDSPGEVAFKAGVFSAAEGQVLRVGAERLGGVAGPLQVTPVLTGSGANPATVGKDIALVTPSLQWADQEGGFKDILISVAADNLTEPTETAQLQLQASSSSLIGNPGTATLELLDRTVAGSADSPVVATDADGLELSVWTVVEPTGSDRDIVGRFTAGLTPSVSPLQFVIAGTPGVDEFDPEVLPLADTFLVFWSASDSDDKRKLLFCEIDTKTGGCRVRPKALVLDASATEFSAVTDGVAFWLLWRTGSGLRLAQFDRGGRVIGRRQTVTSDSSAAQPRLARWGNHGVFASWTAFHPLVPGDPTTARPLLQGRAFDPLTGFQSVLPDLAGPEAVEMRDFKLATRADGSALLSWVGVTIKVSPAGALREGPQIHLRRVGLSGTPDAGEVVLGCSACGDLVETHSVVAAPGGDCVVTWVSAPADGVSAPIVTRAQLRNCRTERSEAQLHLIGPAFRVHRVEMGSANGNLLVLGQRASALSLDLRTYRCDGGTQCRN
jgi:hypothetical protein